ncbi:MAG: ATP-binding protein, partial [Candidatus Korarchaeota archaeon]|nr:ATP-binding protein [Candidatus Korarchaeota archaeon]
GVRSSYLFLDEVTSLRGWWRVIKGYVDAGFFSRDVLVLTGSSSLRLRGEAELFPGRMGSGREVVAWPLSFREFLGVMGVEVRTTGDLDRDVARLLPKSREIRELFLDYLEVGGFPLSVNRDPRAVEYTVRSLEGEILRAGRDPQLARGVISSILRKAPSPVSYASIGSDLSVSHRTVREYVEVLRALMVLGSAMLRRGGRVVWRKERKFFFLDPFTAGAMSIWTVTDFLEGALYEWVVQAHLLRRFGEVFYYRNSHEVDALADGLRVEVKAGKPHRRYPRGVRILDEENIHLFLAVVA